MQKRNRRLLFWLAVLIFGAASYIIILYAQGYKYDFSQNTFMRTGAIAVTVNTDASLYVDDRLVGATSFIGHRVGDNRILPGDYNIRLVRDGYSAWHKTATVKEGLLTDFPKVMLLPTDEESLPGLRKEASASLAEVITLAKATPLPTATPPIRSRVIPTPTAIAVSDFQLVGKTLYRTNVSPATEIADGVLGFQLTNDGSRILWYTRNELWVMWLTNTDYQPFRTENETVMLTRFSVPIMAAAWFRDVDHIIVDMGAQSYRVVETDTRSNINIIRF